MILKEWNRVFDNLIPDHAARTNTQITELWASYLSEIKQHIMETAPSLEGHFIELHPSLESIGTEYCKRLDTVVREIRKSSNATREVFDESLRVHLLEIFREAVKMKGEPCKTQEYLIIPITGLTSISPQEPGCFQRHQTFIEAQVQLQCPTIFATAWETMTKARRQCVLDRLAATDKIPKSMFKAAENKLSILLDNLDAKLEEDPGAVDKNARVKKNVKGLALEWRARWQTPGTNAELAKRENLDIPEEYYEDLAQLDKGPKEEEEEDAMSEGDDWKLLSF